MYKQEIFNFNPDEIGKQNIPIMAKGGELAETTYSQINYPENWTAQNLWENWNTDQREHFLIDHKNHYIHAESDYNSLTPLIQERITKHLSEGAYAKGGLTVGKSHKDGGIPMTVKNTGQKIEVEGGEGIINKLSMSDSKKHSFDGKQMSNCEVISEINSQNNQGVTLDCDSIEGRKYLLGGGVHPLPPDVKYQSGGIYAGGGELQELLGDNDYDHYVKERKRKHLANGGVTMMEIYKPKKSLGYSRNQMPQVRTKYRHLFYESLSNDGIDFWYNSIHPNSLTPSQNEINVNRANKVEQSYKDLNPIIVSNDNWILDGHHTWFSDKLQNKNSDVIVIDLPIKDLIQRVKDFDLVEYQELARGGMLNESQASLFAEGGEAIALKYLTKPIPKQIYTDIFGDEDKDGIANPDDYEPLRPSKDTVEEVSLKEEMEIIIDYRNKFEDVRENFVKKLGRVTEACGDVNCGIFSRTKTPYSIINKLRRRSVTNTKDLEKLEKQAKVKLAENDLTGLDLYKGLTDIVGTMVVAPDKQTLDKVKQALLSGQMGKVLEFEDFYAEDNNGYRAYHFLIGVEDKDVDNPKAKKIYPIEVQVKTDRYKKLSDAGHTLYKKGLVDGKKMNEIGNLIVLADSGNEEAQQKADNLLSNPKSIAKFLAKDKMNKGGYLVFNYTDGFYASPDIFDTKEEAETFIKNFPKRFEQQGYYRTNTWEQISPFDVDLKVLRADEPFARGGEIGSFYFDTRYNKPFKVISIDGEKMVVEYFDTNTKTTQNKNIDKSEFDYNVQMGAWGKYTQPPLNLDFAKGGAVNQNIIIAENYLPVNQRSYIKGLDIETQDDLLKRVAKDIEDIGKLGSQENASFKNAIVYLHYFNATGCDWYITELDKKTNEAFGYAILNGDEQMSEFGYIPLTEIISMDIGIKSPELDLHWKRQTLNERFEKRHPSLVSQPVEYYKEEVVEVIVEEKKTEDVNIDTKFKNPYLKNKAIEDLIDEKGETADNYSGKEKELLATYTGMGGLEKYGATGKGLLYEYYTPEKVASFMWGLVYKHKGQTPIIRALENSVGAGVFVKTSPDDVYIDGLDISKYAIAICKVLYGHLFIDIKDNQIIETKGEFRQSIDTAKYPKCNFEKKYFEELFIQQNFTIKDKLHYDYDLVIGNCPYGKFSGQYSAMGEKQYTKATSYVEYFISRGIDCLKPNGFLCYIIGTPVGMGGVPFLDKIVDSPTEAMRKIMDKANLVDAYRLGSGVFTHTDIDSDIILLQKKANK